MPSCNAADRIPNLTGKTIGDKYQLLEFLGSGAYGVVYNAIAIRTARSRRPVYRAVKAMPKKDLKKYELYAISKEIQYHLACAKQPGVVSIYDVYDSDSYFYLVLELCTGGDLFTRISELRAYEDNDELARTAFLSLVDAVIAMHDRGIAHRDLKPENILVSEDGSRLLLSDFGLATDEVRVTMFGWGTGIYMSPEASGTVLAKAPYCPRTSDIWALGIILINMLSGRNPWSRAKNDDKLFMSFIENPDYLYESLPISRSVANILRRTLSLDPRRRIKLAELRQEISDAPQLTRSMPDSWASAVRENDAVEDIPQEDLVPLKGKKPVQGRRATPVVPRSCDFDEDDAEDDDFVPVVSHPRSGSHRPDTHVRPREHHAHPSQSPSHSQCSHTPPQPHGRHAMELSRRVAFDLAELATPKPQQGTWDAPASRSPPAHDVASSLSSGSSSVPSLSSSTGFDVASGSGSDSSSEASTAATSVSYSSNDAIIPCKASVEFSGDAEAVWEIYKSSRGRAPTPAPPQLGFEARQAALKVVEVEEIQEAQEEVQVVKPQKQSRFKVRVSHALRRLANSDSASSSSVSL